MVKFEVAGKDKQPVRRLDNDTHGVRDSVRYREKSHAQVADADSIFLLHFVDVDRLQVRKFLLTLFYHDGGESAGKHLGVPDAVDDVGDAADVVEVAVRDEHAAYLFATLFEIFCVRQNVVDARRIRFAELEPAVDDDDVITKLDRGHVLADLLNTSKRDDANVASLQGRDDCILTITVRMATVALLRKVPRRVHLMWAGAALAYAAASSTTSAK